MRRIRRYLFGYSTRMSTLRIGVCMSKYQFPALSSLKAFESAARHRSMKKAGDELHVTPTAVSRHVQKLERELGCSLFERRHRRIALTDAGVMLFSDLAVGFDQIQRGFEQLIRNPHPERLVISVDPDFAALWLVPRLAEFYAIVRNTLVEILAQKGPKSSDDRRLDCVIQYAPAGLNSGNGEMLFRSRLFPVCSPSLRKMLPLRSPEDLQHHVLLHDRSVVEWQEYLRRCSMAVDVNAGVGTIFSETALCLDAAARGQGVAIGDDFLAAMHLSEGRLVKPFGPAFFSENAYYFIIPKKEARHPAIAAFRNWLFRSIDGNRNNLRMRRLGSG
jgi:LysR family transcriptional regulator, glycine cleavage system transcriptional activator